MNAVDVFQLPAHSGPYEEWPERTELMMHGKLTGVTIPGYVIEAQYQYAHGYLLVTSWDCLFEEAQTFIGLSLDLTPINHKTVGAPYASVWLEEHHAVDDTSAIFHCDNGLDILVSMSSSQRVSIKYLSKKKTTVTFFQKIKWLLKW